MDIKRKCLAVVLALVLLFGTTGTVSASTKREPADCIRQLITYYRYYQNHAATDLECLLYELTEIDPAKGETWASIMDYWTYVNEDMVLYPDVLPDGLPQDNSLCIVVMGYALSSDGSMRAELIGRLEAALASAQKYPNAYIACTGGGTAKNNKSVTEAGKMAQWLKNRGVDESRIIVENRSLSTVTNAINTCRILATEYPRVTHLALITSDYHLPRSCLLFYTQAVLTANQGAPLLCIAANAAYKTTRPDPESIEIQSDNLAQLIDLSLKGAPKPPLSKLSRIVVSGDTQFLIGEDLDMQVVAHYDTGLYRDVSGQVKYAGIDLSAAGVQDVTITYGEGGIEASATVQVELLMPETEAPTEMPTEVPTEIPATFPAQEMTEPKTTPATVPAPEEDPAITPWWFLPTTAILLLMIAVLLITKKFINRKQKTKRRRRPVKKRSDSDDSPMEYI